MTPDGLPALFRLFLLGNNGRRLTKSLPVSSPRSLALTRRLTILSNLVFLRLMCISERHSVVVMAAKKVEQRLICSLAWNQHNTCLNRFNDHKEIKFICHSLISVATVYSSGSYRSLLDFCKNQG